MFDWNESIHLPGTGPRWAHFDVDVYKLHDAKAAQAARKGEQAALRDFLDRGAALNYAPNVFFDASYYLSSNPSAARAVKDGDAASAFEHYAKEGYNYFSPHWLFDLKYYAFKHSDLSEHKVQVDGGFYGHYLTYGDPEIRAAHPLFDGRFVKSQLAPDATRPFADFLASLRRKGPKLASSPLFDSTWYLANYADAAAAVAAGTYSCALHHYLARGMLEQKDPLCDFSEQQYLADNPDVSGAVQSGLFANGYQHFLWYGIDGLRSPSRDIDLPWYWRLPRVQRDMKSGQFSNVFYHLIQVGLKAGLPLRPPVRSDFSLDETETRQAFNSVAQRALVDYGRTRLDFTVAGQARVTVIIALRNHFALTMQCLASLRTTFPGAIDLILVDNGSSDDTRHIEELLSGARVIRLEENIGFLRACNLALGHATAPAVLYLNNDVILGARSIELALQRLSSDAGIGAVGGKIIRTHGLLQEAGCILWRDGGTQGWMRDARPDAPEVNFVRDVDFCSGCFLMVDGPLLHRLGGFDEAFAPAYYEETDLCLRIIAAGYRVVYDPAVQLTHLEYASSRTVRAATSQILKNRAVLRKRHAVALRRRPVNREAVAEAALFHSRGRRILFIEDTIPIHRLGSGLGRSADVIAGIVAAGWQATVFPMNPVTTPVYRFAASLPETTELLWDRDRTSLRSFLDERAGLYDVIWVSRAHNLRQLVEIAGLSTNILGSARIVLDTEAVFSVRDAAKARLDGLPFDLAPALTREFEHAWLCDHIVAVSDAEAAVIAGAVDTTVNTVGLHQVPRPQPRTFAERSGLLHLGGILGDTTPNYDGLHWYVTEVHPIVKAALGAEAARLTVAGFVPDELDAPWLRDNPDIRLVGAVDELSPLFDACRVFIAPTRFAAGVPVKVVDAAAFGTPIVCTELLAGQLGWTNGVEVSSAAEHDAKGFAQAVIELCRNEKRWASIRDNALEAVRQTMNGALFARQLDTTLEKAGARRPVRPVRPTSLPGPSQQDQAASSPAPAPDEPKAKAGRKPSPPRAEAAHPEKPDQ